MSVVALRSEAAAGPDLDRLLPAITADFAATAATYDREGRFPFANVERLHSDGLLAFTAPASWAARAPTCPRRCAWSARWPRASPPRRWCW